MLHEGTYSINKLFWDINNTIQKLIRLKFKYIEIPDTWPQMITILDAFRPTFQYKVVSWINPPQGWWKCNTDGASRGNPGPSATAFCVRNFNSDLVGAKGLKIEDSINTVVEAIAIREGLWYCREHGFLNIIIKTDSSAMVNILNGV